MGVPHFLAIPYPVQGHINPLIQLCHVLAKYGKVTFLNTHFNHKRTTTISCGGGNPNINYVSLPDGLEADDDRSDREKQLLSIKRTMPPLLPKLIEDVNALHDVENKISCIIVTGNMGQPTKKQEIQILPTMPTINSSDLPWLSIGTTFFTHLLTSIENMKLGEWWLCNTAYDLEPGSFSMSQKFLPIGPLMEINDTNKCSFWQEDTTCLEWLDQQQPQSVIYVAFGSMAVVEPNQLKELGLALDLINKPFLWVVRPCSNLENTFPIEFQGHKGICGGVPFLCWPFFADQFVNKAYICGVWKIGIELEKDDESGLILREEIKKKVEQLLGNEGIRARSMKLKELTMNNIVPGGQSSKNIQKFINWAK
ncbi:hypothetical protein AHAS_Ahas14G0234000 [Arachis hypogaea]